MRLLLFILIAFCQIGLLIYYYIFNQIKNCEVTQTELDRNIPISVIICAKNEIENLEKNIDSWLQQKHNNFDLIIVNDGSSDRSSEFLKEQQKKNSRLIIVEIPKEDVSNLKGKRNALKKGIETAKNEFLLLSDADCMPISENWISVMANSFSTEKEVVLGYSPYKNKDSVVNLLIQYDTVLTAFQYLGFANIQMPYMGVGRNVGYKKALFSDSILESSNKSISGDDDLILAQIANDKNTVIQINKDSFVESEPVESYRDLLRQKSRHLAAGFHYSLKWKIILSAFYFLNISHYFLIFWLLFCQLWIAALVVYGLRLLFFLFFSVKPLEVLNSKKLIKSLWIIDLVYWVNSIIIHIFRTFSNSDKFRRG